MRPFCLVNLCSLASLRETINVYPNAPKLYHLRTNQDFSFSFFAPSILYGEGHPETHSAHP